MVCRLKKDRSLVDAEIVGGYPAVRGIDGPALRTHVRVGEARVEAVEETIVLENAGAVVGKQSFGRRDHDLGREGQRTERCRRRQRTVVALVGFAQRPTRGIAEEGPLLALER